MRGFLEMCLSVWRDKSAEIVPIVVRHKFRE